MTAQAEVARTVREDWGRLTALLLARFRRLDLVEAGRRVVTQRRVGTSDAPDGIARLAALDHATGGQSV